MPQFGAFLMPVHRLDRVDDVQHVALGQQRLPHGTLVSPQPPIPSLLLPLEQGPPHAVLREELLDVEHLGAAPVLAQHIDVRLPRPPVESRRQRRADRRPLPQRISAVVLQSPLRGWDAKKPWDN